MEVTVEEGRRLFHKRWAWLMYNPSFTEPGTFIFSEAGERLPGWSPGPSTLAEGSFHWALQLQEK